MITYEPRAGDSIYHAAREACALANKEPVQFTFNDIKVVVLPGDHASTIERLWSALTDARRARYLLKKAAERGWIPSREDASLANSIYEEVA